MEQQLLTRESPDFKIFSGLLKAVEADDGRKHIRAIASSTVKDLHGDTMQLSAIQSMAASAKENMTIWLNHEYEVPGDIFGSVADSKISNRAADADGNVIYDLDFDIVVNDTNPRAIDTWQAIRDGVKLGVSIGAMLKDYVLNKDGTYNILDVELLEASIVGIPANPRSWIQNAVWVAKARARRDDLAVHGVTLNSTSTNTNTTLRLPNVVEWQPVVTESVELEGDIADFEVVDETGEDDEAPDIEAASCPDCGGSAAKPKGGCGNSMHKSAEPEVIDAVPTEPDIAAELGETETPEAQGAPNTESESEPENADGLQDETADGDDEALGDEVTEELSAAKSVTELVDVLRTTTIELVDARAVNLRLTTERDLAIKGFFAVKDLLDQVATLPLARKAQGEFAELQKSYARFAGVYNEEFLKMLEK